MDHKQTYHSKNEARVKLVEKKNEGKKYEKKEEI